MKRICNRAFSLMEVLVASLLTVMVLGTTVMAMVMGTSNWIRGTAGGVSSNSAQRAVRVISDQLREAMSVAVDGDGQGLTYVMPAKDEDGTFTAPPVSDGVVRRIELDGTDINLVADGTTRTICKNISPTDPNTGGSYLLFTAGSGSVTRSITILVATTNVGDLNKTYSARYRETIFLRNIPELTQ